MSIQLGPIADELASLREQVRQLEASVGKRHRSRLPGRAHRGFLVAAVALTVAAVVGVAGASAPGNPADVAYISLSVPHKVLNNIGIGKTATNSPVVIGASTTVPSDATSVRMTVSVKSTVAGTLSIFPTDNPTGSTADTVSFSAGNVVTTETTEQSPGLSGKVSFKNNGTATASVTVTISGYSTQTTASNISGSGGTDGQVLTNTGSGATWQTPSPAYEDYEYPNVALTNGETTVASLALPAGSYQLSVSTTLFSLAISYASCAILSRHGDLIDSKYVNTGSGQLNDVIQLQGLLTTDGGAVTVSCTLYAYPGDNSREVDVYATSLIATAIGSASGDVTTD
jgi:hypothetical protein